MGMTGEWSHPPPTLTTILMTCQQSWEFGDAMWDLKSTGIFLISLLGAERSKFIQIIPYDVTVCRRDDKRTVLRECVDRLGSPLEYERLWNLCLEFYPLTPSGIESSAAVLISNLLSDCSANLRKCCFYCYLLFENKVSLSVTYLLDCFNRTHSGTNFVTT
ncbi:hypothetical protein AVEN_26136-1 [Araneus ventricosus]|uniref:Uncharacterized protein n=1 Tax=Araneus ventricosus TaxID=182803 RepID=A0A4Y2SY72_ARAVE|nr:hypothetical protein AVEN_26136-1 [Araneus ventricosus]